MKQQLRILILFVLASCFSFGLIAQGEKPIVREGVKWTYLYDYGTSSEYKMWCFFKDSTKIDNIQYHNCYMYRKLPNRETELLDTFFLRQEGKKVYLRAWTWKGKDFIIRYPFHNYYCKIDTPKVKEILIYDFSCNKGDSWKMIESYISTDPRDSINNLRGVGNEKQVDSISTDLVGGVQTKVQHVHCAPAGYVYNTLVYEGMGPIEYSLFPIPYLSDRPAMTYTNGFFWLYKFEDENGNVLWDYITWWNQTHGISFNRTGDRLAYIRNTLNIKSDGAWNLQIYRSDGQVMMTHYGVGEDNVNLEMLPKGIYIARLQSGNSTQTLKIMR